MRSRYEDEVGTLATTRCGKGSSERSQAMLEAMQEDLRSVQQKLEARAGEAGEARRPVALAQAWAWARGTIDLASPQETEEASSGKGTPLDGDEGGETFDAFTAALRRVWYLGVALTVAMILPFFLIKWLNVNKIGRERAEQAEAAKKEARKAQEEA